uniref:DDB1 and CUL4 associated factor 11 n=1 Tax=Mus musculus TaxID=10090 RepID=D6REI5_MOUSE
MGSRNSSSAGSGSLEPSEGLSRRGTGLRRSEEEEEEDEDVDLAQRPSETGARKRCSKFTAHPGPLGLRGRA